jgi:peptidoglycan/LPS O-acetylase OafA/YrhL
MNKKIIALAAFICALVPIVAMAQDTGDGTTTPLDSLSTFALWAIVAGFVGSFIVAVINRAHWSSAVKFGVFFVWCCVAAAADAYFKRELDLSDWSRALLLIFVAGQATYIAGKPAIKEIEVRTT